MYGELDGLLFTLDSTVGDCLRNSSECFEKRGLERTYEDCVPVEFRLMLLMLTSPLVECALSSLPIVSALP